MGTYVVYDLAGETAGYEGVDYGAAYAEWVRRNGMPATPDGNTVSINAWGIDDFADRFPPTWATRLRERAFDARWTAAIVTMLAIALWPLSLGVAALVVAGAWLALRLRRRHGA
jgi:hypothetical protein